MKLSFFKTTDQKTISAEEPSTTQPTWEQNQAHFLSAVRTLVETGDSDSDLTTAWESLCRQCGEQTTVTEWEFLCRELHGLCETGFALEKSSTTTTSTPPSVALQTVWQQALPPIAPMQWHLESCTDATAADIRTKSLQKKSSGISTSTLLYWSDAENLHFRYCRSNQKPYDLDLNKLRMTIKPSSQPDPIVENILSLLTIQEALTSHPHLTSDILRTLLSALQQEKHLFLPSTPVAQDDKQHPRRIICQARSSGNVYLGEWFAPQTDPAVPRHPLPGDWTLVYPDAMMETLVIDDSQGWVSLNAIAHPHLLALLQQQAEQQRRHQIYTELCKLYPIWESNIKEHLAPAFQVVWHTTIAEAAAQQQRWLPMLNPSSLQSPSAITHGCLALALCETSDPVSTMAIKIHTWLDPWVQTYSREILQRLLPHYKAQFDATLQPLQRPTGQLSLSDFQIACRVRRQIMPLLFWPNPTTAQTAEKAFQNACTDRQNDILSQIHGLAKLLRATPEQQEELQTWQHTLQDLLKQWREAGYHALVAAWQVKLRKQLSSTGVIAEAPLPEDSALAALKKGLAAPLVKPGVPGVWEQAHQSALQCLNSYAIHHQFQAFTQAKRRYGVRLRSYQLFCEQLNTAHPEYAELAAWCQSHYAELQRITPDSLVTAQLPPIPWRWQTLRHLTEQTPTERLQQLCTHLRTQLSLAPPCDFELVLMQSTLTSTDWRLHILVAEDTHRRHDYFVAYQQLFQLYAALLSSEISTTITVDINTPKSLAGVYCPIETLTHSDTTALIYLPVWHQHYAAASAPGKPQHLFTTFIRQIVHGLTQVVAQGQAEEKAIRIKYHALATQPLIESEERAIQLKDVDLADPTVMLKRRQQAHHAIHRLWQAQQTHYAPLIDLLVYVAITMPAVIEEYLGKAESATHQEAKQQDESDLDEKPRRIPKQASRLHPLNLLCQTIFIGDCIDDCRACGNPAISSN